MNRALWSRVQMGRLVKKTNGFTGKKTRARRIISRWIQKTRTRKKSRPHPYATARRYEPAGTTISNRAPVPGTPVSRIVIPVMDKISRTRKSPRPVCLP